MKVHYFAVINHIHNFVLNQQQDGWNSMMYAALLGHDDIVEILLQYGASVHTTNKVTQ